MVSRSRSGFIENSVWSCKYPCPATSWPDLAKAATASGHTSQLRPLQNSVAGMSRSLRLRDSRQMPSLPPNRDQLMPAMSGMELLTELRARAARPPVIIITAHDRPGLRDDAVRLGAAAYLALPVAQYPEIAPPTVQVTASYPGASAEVVSDTVSTPLEQEINGVEGMLYMVSQATADGQLSLTMTFALGTDLDIAQVLVQNRVARSASRCERTRPTC